MALRFAARDWGVGTEDVAAGDEYERGPDVIGAGFELLWLVSFIRK
jgi:hypothetical protein